MLSSSALGTGQEVAASLFSHICLPQLCVTICLQFLKYFLCTGVSPFSFHCCFETELHYEALDFPELTM